jgi:hypothetical protein
MLQGNVSPFTPNHEQTWSVMESSHVFHYSGISRELFGNLRLTARQMVEKAIP